MADLLVCMFLHAQSCECVILRIIIVFVGGCKNFLRIDKLRLGNCILIGTSYYLPVAIKYVVLGICVSIWLKNVGMVNFS